MELEDLKLYNEENTRMKILDCKLLSVEEVNKVDDIIRKADGPWWLRSSSDFYPINKHHVACVIILAGSSCDIIYKHGYSVDEILSVRPALYLESNAGKSFKLAGHNWINVFDNVYLCEDLIGKSIFNNLSDGNDYEGSVIQKYVLSWCKSKNIEFNTEIDFEEM